MSRFRNVMLGIGLVFLYLPILSMMVFSFNNSRLVTVWDQVNSPTLRWYWRLFENEQLLSAAWISVKIAALSASGAVVLGTLAALALVRAGAFRGRALLAALTTAPLVMPEIIMGIAMLLLFVALEQWTGWPAGRGFVTITIAHVTFTMAYVTVVVQSRLAVFEHSLEEAALDLGARPVTVFFRVTLPLILPAILSGWLLAFTLSWDDVVISQFVSGPGASTLPVEVFSRVRRGVSPDINALGTLVVVMVSIGVVSSFLYMRGRERRREREAQLARDP
ncbi:MAG: ABC transporter permease subunit [Steroidobacteraceae bacterium]